MKISEIWLYPVKSMLGEPLDQATVGGWRLAVGDKNFSVSLNATPIFCNDVILESLRCQVYDDTRRCIMVTAGQGDLSQDMKVTRGIVQNNKRRAEVALKARNSSMVLYRRKRRCYRLVNMAVTNPRNGLIATREAQLTPGFINDHSRSIGEIKAAAVFFHRQTQTLFRC